MNDTLECPIIVEIEIESEGKETSTGIA
jgi:hypothetical protein